MKTWKENMEKSQIVLSGQYVPAIKSKPGIVALLRNSISDSTRKNGNC